MEFDKVFRIPFRQQIVYEGGDTLTPILDFGQAASTATKLGYTGQTASDVNSPVLPDVYSQLLNYKFMKIHALEVEMKVTDYAETNTQANFNRFNGRVNRDPNAALLARLITNQTDYAYVLGTTQPDADDRQRVNANTKRGTSFAWRLPTGMRMMSGAAGRGFLTNTGRDTVAPGTQIGPSRAATGDNPGNAWNLTATQTFYIGNGLAYGTNFVNANRGNIFYWSLGQLQSAVGGVSDVVQIAQKYYFVSPNWLPFSTVVDQNSFPRCIAICPLVDENSVSGLNRKWTLQVIVTFVVKARQYIPTAATSSRMISMFNDHDEKDDDNTIELD